MWMVFRAGQAVSLSKNLLLFLFTPHVLCRDAVNLSDCCRMVCGELGGGGDTSLNWRVLIRVFIDMLKHCD